MNRTERGFSLIELMIVMLIMFIITSMTFPLFKSAILRAQAGAVASDARTIHLAFKRYYIDNDEYPNAGSTPAFNLATFEPLVSGGYYGGQVLPKLEGDQVDAYDSPDDEGVNQEFWLEMTLKVEPRIRFLIADSDNAPLGGGDDYNGIYMFKDGVLTPMTSPVSTN